MSGNQLSLRTLFAAIAIFAAGLALGRGVWWEPWQALGGSKILLVLGSGICFGTAIGLLVKRPRIGALAGCLLMAMVLCAGIPDALRRL